MRVRRLVPFVAAAALLAACGGSDPEPGNAAGSPATESPTTSSQPTQGGTLSVAIDSDPGSLNPAITTSGATHTASELLYNGLVGLSSDLEPEPELAESWEVLEDGALYRFDLRNDVTYRELQELLVEDLPYLWLVETESTRVFTTQCQGFSAAGHFAETAFCER